MAENENYENPLQVHTEDDVDDNSAIIQMTNTREEDDTPDTTLERHRFKKEKKKSNWWIIVVVLFLIAIAVAIGAKYGNFSKVTVQNKKETTTEAVTTIEQKFKNTVTIQGSDLYFEGKYLKGGYEELASDIKYMDKDTTFFVQDEKANSDFIENIEELIKNLGFKYEVKIIAASGLTKPTTTTKAKTTKKATTAKAKTAE